MAAVQSAQTATLTPPTSSHGQDESWGHVGDHAQGNHGHDFALSSHNDYDTKSQTFGRNGNTFSSGAQMATRRMRSADDLHGEKWEDTENATLLPPYAPDSQIGSSNRSRSPFKGREEDQGEWIAVAGNGDEDSKWIHRDKLAKIESQELQAAGLYVPTSRAPSKQRRDRSRSRSAMRRGTESSETGQSRSRKNSSAVEQRAFGSNVPSWDLRTPEEIAEEEANAYFTNDGLGGSSRIPVAKMSPAPISLDAFERGSPSTRKYSESPEGDFTSTITTVKARSRSASATMRLDKPNGSLNGKRTQADVSPKKATGNRKMSSGARSVVNQRPKTRSGSSTGTGTRPSTRSGESPPHKQPEGDPPWMVNSYKPDPRLPPDQQLLPTVARRLQQERWEKEGTYDNGDVYDKEFRPLNDKGLLKPPSPVKLPPEEPQPDAQPSPGEWPLRAETKSPSIRQGAYSTMPKISDKPGIPMTSPRPPNSPLMFQPQLEPGSPAVQRVTNEKEKESKKKGGCGCCIVM